MRRAAFAIPGDIETLTGGYIYERRLLEELRAAGRDVDHVALPGSFPDPTPEDTAATVAALRAVPPDRVLILDGFIPGSLDPAGIAALRAPFVAVTHHPLALEAGLSDARAAHLRETERANLARAAHVLVPSPHTRALLIDGYGVPPDRITVARPGVTRPSGPPAPTDPPLILSVGILHPRKGHDVLIAALDRIRDLPWRAVIVGADWDPPHAAGLRAQVAATGLGDRVKLAGKVGADRLDRFWREATVFALATRFEGYGIVFDEAIAAGLPIVTCRTGAVPDTVPPDAGRLVPPDDPAAFADALRSVLTDDALRARLAAAAQSRAVALNDWADTAAIAGRVIDGLPA